jgi:hypothetical protein
MATTTEQKQVEKRIDDVKFFVAMLEDEWLAGNEQEAFNWAEGLDSAARSPRGFAVASPAS